MLVTTELLFLQLPQKYFLLDFCESIILPFLNLVIFKHRVTAVNKALSGVPTTGNRLVLTSFPVPCVHLTLKASVAFMMLAFKQHASLKTRNAHLTRRSKGQAWLAVAAACNQDSSTPLHLGSHRHSLFTR